MVWVWWFLALKEIQKQLTLFPPFLLSSALLAYTAIIMHPDQTAPLGAVWSGFLVLATMVKVFLSAFEYMQQT